MARQGNGDWEVRLAFSSNMGVLRIVGKSTTDLFLKAESKRLIVLGLEYPLGGEPLFGFDITGASYYLGEHREED